MCVEPSHGASRSARSADFFLRHIAAIETRRGLGLSRTRSGVTWCKMSIGKTKARNVGAKGRGESPLLREIIRTHQVLMRAFTQTIGMPPSRVVLMRLLAKMDGKVTSSDLARQLGTKASLVTRQLGEMEADGLIRKHPDPSDRRRSHFQLSPRGQKAFRASHVRSRQLEQALLSKLGRKETTIATDVLARLRRCIEPPTPASTRGVPRRGRRTPAPH